MTGPVTREHFCKDCRYWYGAHTAASFGRGLSAPYRPHDGPWRWAT